MKTKLAILVALASVGASTGSYALGGAISPVLYPSEQGAFKALEAVTQIAESRIVQKGCQTVSFPVEIHTTAKGSGYALVGGARVDIVFQTASKNDGRWYKVTGAGALNGMTVAGLTGEGSFNIGSSIQELSTTWDATSYVTGLADHFKGTIIKNYELLPVPTAIPETADNFFENAGTLVTMVHDDGLQQVTKNHYVKAKYWQESYTWRDDGVNAGTWWVKNRIAPVGCSIEVKLAGYGLAPTDSIEGFNEKGTISISTNDVVGPFFKKAANQ